MIKKFMKIAIDEAISSVEKGGGPFGALIVRNGKVISRSRNQVIQDHDPTAHAEMLVIRKAASILGTCDLSDCEIYSSCEPCPMCLGAIYWAHIPIIYYGSNRLDAKNAGFDDSYIYGEFQLNPENRKVKMINIQRDKALEAFENWTKHPGKKEY